MTYKQFSPSLSFVVELCLFFFKYRLLKYKIKSRKNYAHSQLCFPWWNAWVHRNTILGSNLVLNRSKGSRQRKVIVLPCSDSPFQEVSGQRRASSEEVTKRVNRLESKSHKGWWWNCVFEPGADRAHKYPVGQWHGPHDVKLWPVMGDLGSCQIMELFLRQSYPKIEWPTLQGSELLIIRDVQTRTAWPPTGDARN